MDYFENNRLQIYQGLVNYCPRSGHYHIFSLILCRTCAAFDPILKCEEDWEKVYRNWRKKGLTNTAYYAVVLQCALKFMKRCNFRRIFIQKDSIKFRTLRSSEQPPSYTHNFVALFFNVKSTFVQWVRIYM